eukprot:scaffold6571_cov114-Isochrysis_galbana.AAC.3
MDQVDVARGGTCVDGLGDGLAFRDHHARGGVGAQLGDCLPPLGIDLLQDTLDRRAELGLHHVHGEVGRDGRQRGKGGGIDCAVQES